MTDESGPPKPGLRKDGRPFKEGNTRDDGSYSIGKNRTSEHTRFAKNDGRKRGRRAKGTANLSTDWKEELAERIEITENGRKKKITKQRGIVKSLASRAMKSSDRAAEIAMRHANERDERTGKLRLADEEIMERWLAQRFAQLDEPKLLDDADRQDLNGDLPADVQDGEQGSDPDADR